MLDDGNLETLFNDHEYYASTTNAMLQRYGHSPICTKGVLKPFTIEDGVIVITQHVVVEPEPTPEPEVIVDPEPIIEPPLPDMSEPT